MAKIWVEEGEWYPVVSMYKECPDWMDAEVFESDTVEVSDDLIARFEAAKKAFADVNHEMRVAAGLL